MWLCIAYVWENYREISRSPFWQHWLQNDSIIAQNEYIIPVTCMNDPVITWKSSGINSCRWLMAWRHFIGDGFPCQNKHFLGVWMCWSGVGYHVTRTMPRAFREHLVCGLLHTPGSVAVGLSMGYETWLSNGVIVWSKYRLGTPHLPWFLGYLQCITGSRVLREFLPHFQSDWQSLASP